jgi:dTDP-4-dehydrorhamnose reductase
VRVLILGGDGLLGHAMVRGLQAAHDVAATLHGPREAYRQFALLQGDRVACGVDVRDEAALRRAIAWAAPQAIINCVGLVKRDGAGNPAAEIAINALFPHRLAEAGREAGAKLIQFSTDCVFSGRKGRYTEGDPPDEPGLHGRCKALGEVVAPQCLVLRSSVIGRELSCRRSLVEWYLAQRGVIRGYRRAIYSGFTTREMARIVDMLLVRQPDMHGVWHVASAPISKFDLLSGLHKRLHREDARIEPWDGFACDRSLDGSRFAQATGYRAPEWDRMLDELAGEIAAGART